MTYKEINDEILQQMISIKRENIRPTQVIMDRRTWHTMLRDHESQRTIVHHYQRKEDGPDMIYGLVIGVTSNDSYFLEVK